MIEQPVARDSSVDFICFTDDPNATSTSWHLIVIEPIFPFDMVRSQRSLKIRGHESLRKYDELLYIDNAVLLKQDPNEILDDWLATCDYAVPPHSFRERVIDEFDEVLALNYDDPARVSEQLMQYAELYPDILNQRPFWNGMSARRNTRQVREMMATWFDHVLRFSRRDQLSANVAFALGGVTINAVDEDNLNSPSHQWPAGVNRRTHLTEITRQRSGPLLAALRRTERDLIDANQAIVDLKAGEEARVALELEEKEQKIAELVDALAVPQTRGEAAVVVFGPSMARRLIRTAAVGRRVRQGSSRILGRNNH
ncbi:glycosyltransferase domain-containing protein [Cryobacterium sp. Hb1]|uniref:glycosyltransferase domain-containing protein n=1 Tax=Cryobacterium sp. Hb1 TaxID=1259147 RepID=UPI00141BCAF4|nr:glycosyltransferase domain-containing protein [Cryobacterium sp. Hb1]